MTSNVKTDRIGVAQLHLYQKIKQLPNLPGCYLMKNKDGQVIYVGKAKNLKKRVSSYFQSSSKSPKEEILVFHLDDVDFLITETEVEALILENNLIKKYRPKYNIRLKDDKTYPYILVDYHEKFPRLNYVRRPKRKAKTRICGPFVSGSNITQVLRIVRMSFGIRDCHNPDFATRKVPCLLYQMGHCFAPCVGKISADTYADNLKLALNFFSGNGDVSIKFLEKRMLEEAAVERFERAALIRDNIFLLKEFLDQSKKTSVEIEGKEKDVDIISFYRGETAVEMTIYLIRNKILVEHRSYSFLIEDLASEYQNEILTNIYQYYTSDHGRLPEVVVVPFQQIQRNNLKKALNRSFLSNTIQVRAPGRKYASLYRAAGEYAREHQKMRAINSYSNAQGLNKLKEILKLPEKPRIVECYDVSVWQGSSPTAAKITFHNGIPDKQAYRYFHLEERPEGNNDIAMMRELFKRRVHQGNLPDLFVVDGGRGQVSAINALLNELAISTPVIGIAKGKVIRNRQQTFREKRVNKSDERLYIAGQAEPYSLSQDTALFRLVVEMRDEAHRFSRKLHHKSEGRKLFNSFLDNIRGIGPVTKKKILKKLEKNDNSLRNMSVLQLQKYLGISEAVAENIVKHFN